MSTMVSISQVDETKHIPSRQERDEAFSSGAGRKATEKDKKAREKEILNQKNILDKLKQLKEATQVSDSSTEAPIGLELETRIMPSVGSALEIKARDS